MSEVVVWSIVGIIYLLMSPILDFQLLITDFQNTVIFLFIAAVCGFFLQRSYSRIKYLPQLHILVSIIIGATYSFFHFQKIQGDCTDCYATGGPIFFNIISSIVACVLVYFFIFIGMSFGKRFSKK